MDLLPFLIVSPLWVSFVLFILYQTDAVYEYGKFLPEFLTRRKEYERLAKPYNISYSLYMRTEYDSFLMRMWSCPICSGVWISVMVALLFSRMEFFPFVYLLGQVGYGAFVRFQQWSRRIDGE
jgi:hypothetical protein